MAKIVLGNLILIVMFLIKWNIINFIGFSLPVRVYGVGPAQYSMISIMYYRKDPNHLHRNNLSG